VEVEIHNTSGSSVTSLFVEDAEKILGCSATTKFMLGTIEA
jgi:hypothetical protein